MQVHTITHLATYLTPRGAVLPPQPAEKMWKNSKPDLNIVKKWKSGEYFEFSVLKVLIFTFCTPLLRW
jgi:hypothetical protein